MEKKQAPSLILQERDIALLRDLFESRVMTRRHAATLHFSDREEMTTKRIRKLIAAGLIKERTRKIGETAALFLARKGIELLAAHGILSEYPEFSVSALAKRAEVSEMTLAHELAVMDAKAALCRACRDREIAVDAFMTWPALIAFETSRGTAKPDGLIRLRGNCFYLEVDLSTEPLRTLLAQAQKYRLCRKSAGRLSLNSWCEKRQEHVFTVLYILENEKRLENFARCLLSADIPIRSLVWLATVDAFNNDPLGPIWRRPRDFETTAGAMRSLLDRE